MGLKELGGMSIYGKALGLDKDDPASAGELQKKAEKKAEDKRLAFAASRAEKGKTMFTTPMGRGGGNAGGSNQSLKQTLG